ncbi:hypothetical protein, partial [Streptomyces sp. Mg1]|uniref:hypothetical protein n=1 Tax=Streptomyces sp. Mg1 TaxID=465541 RepID=UPI001F24FBE8
MKVIEYEAIMFLWGDGNNAHNMMSTLGLWFYCSGLSDHSRETMTSGRDDRRAESPGHVSFLFFFL